MLPKGKKIQIESKANGRSSRENDNISFVSLRLSVEFILTIIMDTQIKSVSASITIHQTMKEHQKSDYWKPQQHHRED